jgi:opacity protein-like surface antigen
MGPALPSSGFHPVISVFGGVAGVTVKGDKQTFEGTDEDKFVYHGERNTNTTGFVGVFLGAEHQLSLQNFFIQAGIEYGYFGAGNTKGEHRVGIEPETSTFYRYSWSFQTQQVLAVGKLYTTVQSPIKPLPMIYPYVSLGLGAAFNDSKNYRAVTHESGSINVTPIFKNNSQTMFSYNVGLGVETPVNQHVRIGVGYRFSDFGTAALGKGTVVFNQYRAPTEFSLHANNVYANQFIAQISYVA